MRPLDAAEMTACARWEAPYLKTGAGATVADACDPFDGLTRREWLSTNGTGSFAMGTASGACARRYHALLVAALDPPVRRMTLLSKLDESVTVLGEHYDLSTNRYPDGVVAPDGWRYLTEFSAWPVPTWTYRLPGEAVLVKRVYMARGKNTVYVTYTLRESPALAALTLSPMVCWKDYHSEMTQWPGFPLKQGPEVGGWSVQPTGDSPILRLRLRGAQWSPAGWWHENIVQDRDQERGQDCHEDLFCPAVVSVTLRSGQTAAFSASIEDGEPDDATYALAEIVRRQDELVKQATTAFPAPKPVDTDGSLRDLILASDLFVVEAQKSGNVPARTTILAGYPWFTDWGRDTMISLPGLCLATGRYAEARGILRDFAASVSEGMIPNRFPDSGSTPEYNTADGTLWFVHACAKYVEATGDSEFKEELTPVLAKIVAAHRAGTRYGIRMNPVDCLLSAGEPGTNLTWMDAKIGDWVVTPRIGKPVEINALWIVALRTVAAWSGDATLPGVAATAAASFQHKFVRHDGKGLYDFIAPDGTPDGAVRPNQVIAAAILGGSGPLSPDDLRAVLDIATSDLLTPYGLRTLSPKDSRYRAHYGGDPVSRDSAYHEGTAWPWLIGSYVDLYRLVHGAAADVRPILSSLIAHLREYGVAGIAEIFDGDPPYRPDGCPWQAWSVAEVLRANLPAQSL